MNRNRSWAALFAIGCLVAAAATAQTYPPAPGYSTGTGIANTPHDFTLMNAPGTGPGGAQNSTAIGKCTFCHTPHKAQQSALIWNHTLSTNSYSWSDTTSTVGGTPLPSIATTWNGASKLCLSCHDGTVAIGDVAWFKKAAHQGVAAINPLNMANATLLNSRIADATGSLNKNHPVAHPFPRGGQRNTYNSVQNGVAAAASGWVADPTANGIRLFTDAAGTVAVWDSAASPAATNVGIECSSCHDPHNGSGVQATYFLRGELEGNGVNYLCTKCHVK